MRSEMHGMELAVQGDDVCSTLEQYNRKDMLCVKGLPPRFDSACNVSNQVQLRYQPPTIPSLHLTNLKLEFTEYPQHNQLRPYLHSYTYKCK